MANAGNESDLVVRISVNTREVKDGFDQIISDSHDFANRVQSIVSGIDFSRVFDMTRTLEKSLDEAIGKVTKSKPRELSFRLKFKSAKGDAIGTTVQSGGNIDDAFKDFLEKRNKYIDELNKADEKTPEGKAARKARIQEEHNRAIREYISLLRQLRQIETQMGIAKYNQERYAGRKGYEELSARYGSQYATLSSVRDVLEGRLSGVVGKYGGAKWFNSDEMKRMADLSDQIAKSEAETAIKARELADAKREQEEAEKRLVKAYAASLYIYRLSLRFIRSMVKVTKELISVSDDIYQAQFKLAAAMKVNNQVTNSQIRGMYKYIRALSEASGLSIEVNYNAAQILASYVDTEESLRKLLKTYDDLVIKMKGYNVNGQQAATIAKQLARALAGDTNAVSKYGFVLSEAEKKALKSNILSNAEKVDILVNAIARKTGDISKESETWAGMVNRVRVQSTLIKSNLGLALQNALYPMLKVVLFIAKGFEKVSEGVLELSKFIFGDNIKGAEEMAGWLSEIDDELNSIQSRLLSFDKFNVLSGESFGTGKDGGSGGKSGGDTESPDTGEWKKWLELIGNITGVSEGLKAVLVAIGLALAGIAATMAVLAAMTMVKKIKDMASSLGILNKGLGVTKTQLTQLFAGVTLIITGVMTLVEGIKGIREAEHGSLEWWISLIKIIGGSILTVIGIVLVARVAVQKLYDRILKSAFITKSATAANHGFAASLKTMAAWAASFGVLAIGLSTFLANVEKMGSTASIWIGVAAAITAATAALIAWKVAEAGPAAIAQAAMIAGGIVLAVGTMFATVGKYERGGIPDRGQLFIANEAGPELVGNIGGHTSVANNAMITAAIEEAAYRGFVRANSEGGSSSMSLTIKGDAVRNDALVRALMPALKTEVKRQGGLKKAFGGD